MTAIPFDTHETVKRFKSVGFSEEQAEVQTRVIAELVEGQLATKRDLVELELRLKTDLIKWLVGVAAGQAAFILAALKLFPTH